MKHILIFLVVLFTAGFFYSASDITPKDGALYAQQRAANTRVAFVAVTLVFYYVWTCLRPKRP